MPIKTDEMTIGTDGNMTLLAGTEALLEVPLLPDEIIWKKKSELLGSHSNNFLKQEFKKLYG